MSTFLDVRKCNPIYFHLFRNVQDKSARQCFHPIDLSKPSWPLSNLRCVKVRDVQHNASRENDNVPILLVRFQLPWKKILAAQSFQSTAVPSIPLHCYVTSHCSSP